MSNFVGEFERLRSRHSEDDGVGFVQSKVEAIFGRQDIGDLAEPFGPNFPRKDRVHQLMLYVYQYTRDVPMDTGEPFSPDARVGILTMIAKFQNEAEVAPLVVIENWQKIEDSIPPVEPFVDLASRLR